MYDTSPGMVAEFLELLLGLVFKPIALILFSRNAFAVEHIFIEALPFVLHLMPFDEIFRSYLAVGILFV